ncbi:MAG: hypothetical protein ACR2JY_24660 [Chloroflexota bacterium]
METQQPISAAKFTSRRQRCAADHALVVARTAPVPALRRPAPPLAPSGMPLSPTEAALACVSARILRRRWQPVALRAAWVQVRLLQHVVEELERERDIALADTADLRLRHARPSARFYTLEAEWRAARSAPAAPALTISVVPWYRRFWLGLIGKEVRAAEWHAAPRAP